MPLGDFGGQRSKVSVTVTSHPSPHSSAIFWCVYIYFLSSLKDNTHTNCLLPHKSTSSHQIKNEARVVDNILLCLCNLESWHLVCRHRLCLHVQNDETALQHNCYACILSATNLNSSHFIKPESP